MFLDTSSSVGSVSFPGSLPAFFLSQQLISCPRRLGIWKKKIVFLCSSISDPGFETAEYCAE